MFGLKITIGQPVSAACGGGGFCMEKRCILDDYKLCDECGECQKCDLDPNKICDNCMKCVRSGADYNAIEIDEIQEADS